MAYLVAIWEELGDFSSFVTVPATVWLHDAHGVAKQHHLARRRQHGVLPQLRHGLSLCCFGQLCCPTLGDSARLFRGLWGLLERNGSYNLATQSELGSKTARDEKTNDTSTHRHARDFESQAHLLYIPIKSNNILEI